MSTPHGAWPSPLSAADVTAGTVRLSSPQIVGDEVWWTEGRPAEQGRNVVVRRRADGRVEDVLPAPWNARTRVHEYGGKAWIVADNALVFSHFSDQRMWRLVPGSAAPQPLTPEPDEPGGARYADPIHVGDEIWCIREVHRDGAVTRAVVALPLDGSGHLRTLLTGSDFLAHPRLSPDGRHLAVIAWDHPQMPWDGTELHIASVIDGEVGEPQRLLGSTKESVLQPEWLDDRTLLAVTDRSGWWNLVRVDLDGSVTPVCPVQEELGGPLWTLGSTWYVLLADNRCVVSRDAGLATVEQNGTLRDLDLPFASWQPSLHTDGTQVVAIGASATAAPAVVRLSADGTHEVVHESAALPVGPEWLPRPTRETFPSESGRVVHALRWPPTSPVAQGPAGELPPYVLFVHGGPTSQASTALDLQKAFFTSRGIGVLDVDYGGSTGYGRTYREALREQWGVVDVEDCVAATKGLAAAGHADPGRIAIRGGSAGGWTVLAALTRSDVFAAGASYYGVADAARLAADTHDFESRYLDGLIGPLPESLDRYQQRSPLNNVDGLSCPVLLLQGDEDRVVPPSQAEMFRDALVRKGIRHAYLLFAGEDHGFRRAENIVAALQAELSFYGQVLGFDPPGVPRLPLTGTA